MHAIVEAAMDAVLLVDAEGRIAQANHAADAIFGWAPEELFGTSIRRLFSADPWDVPKPGSTTR